MNPAPPEKNWHMRRVAGGARRVARLGLVLLALAGCKEEPEINWEHKYQATADRIRLLQLRDFALLIERFHVAKGHYPLTQRPGLALPVEVAVSRQPHEGAPTNATAEDLEAELSAGLGEPIKLQRDPQLHDLRGYRQYHYRSDGRTYEVFVHLYFANPLTERIDDVTHRYTLVPDSGPAARIPEWRDDDHRWMADMARIRAREVAEKKVKPTGR
ncbi:MAG: hypothetical protein ABMA01_19360 [Chthoniobacteraceae bacterium]